MQNFYNTQQNNESCRTFFHAPESIIHFEKFSFSGGLW